jgi:predicted DNA-binding protein YlxM (UPF0122 family)
MVKIIEQDFINKYKEYNGCQASLASHYKLSERSIRTYKAKFIKKVAIATNKELEQLYIIDKLSVSAIARYYEVSRDTIYRLLEEHNIYRDSKYDIQAIRKAYVEENCNLTELLVLSGLVNRQSLLTLLKEHDIVNPIKKAITELYIAGLTAKEISLELGMLESVISFNLKHHSIFREKQLLIDKDKLSELRLEKTLDQLASYYKCAARTISAYIKKFQLDRKETIKFIFDLPTITNLYVEQNLTMDEIADIYACSRTTIQHFIRDHGIIATNKENSYERRIREFFENNNIQFEQNNRSVIAPKEIDFYLPDFKVGIELCGLYWHSTKINKNKLHIKKKQELCKDVGVRLITIFEDELLDKFEIVINRLKQLVGVTSSRGYARNCKIKEIDSRQGIDFLNTYHIQGSGKNNIYLGAYLNDELVSVMTFSNRNPAKGHKNKLIELNRFVNPFSVVGIASKLFKYYVKTYNPDKILSYSDNRWNTGNLYSILGFTTIRHTQYNYWYVVKQQRKHRYAFTKHRLLTIFPEEDPTQTEQQIAENHNLYRIYDCGSTVYSWVKK